MTPLVWMVGLYMLASIGIGLWAATRVQSTSDFALAGRSLPLPMVITATFATWFGSETILGMPATFISGGFEAIVEEPFGSGICLILVGLFFAGKLYKMNILTLGDYYRQRYGGKVECACSIFIILSYLGWVAAQVAALGMVLNLITQGACSVSLGMWIGTVVVLVYTIYGGMWSVAVTDFVQMIIIVVGLIVIAIFAGDIAGGPSKVIEYAQSKDLFRFFPEGGTKDWLFWISAALTMMLGSIPQQDVFQRVMSAKDYKTAVAGPILGGSFYLLFAFVPMFITVAAVISMRGTGLEMLESDPQSLLPTLVRDHMPAWLSVVFFGAVLSAVMSTASATMLAPTTTFVENILCHQMKFPEKYKLHYMRVAVFVFGFLVLGYSMYFEGSSIYEMVTMAYQFPIIGAFWPLVMGLYWKRATALGVWCSIVCASIVWAILTFTAVGDTFPNVLGALAAGGFGIIVGSLLPVEANRLFREHKAHQVKKDYIERSNQLDTPLA